MFRDVPVAVAVVVLLNSPLPKEEVSFASELGGLPSGAPYSYVEQKETHEFIFSLVIKASGIARGRVRTTTTTESRNMVALRSVY